MVIYTPYPPEIIFENNSSERSFDEIVYSGVNIQVESLDNKSYKIVRVISSNPNDYLNPNLQPGNIIEATLQAGEI